PRSALRDEGGARGRGAPGLAQGRRAARGHGRGARARRLLLRRLPALRRDGALLADHGRRAPLRRRGRAGARDLQWFPDPGRGGLAARIAARLLPGYAVTQFAEPRVDLALARAHGLTDAEYSSIERILGRTPSYPELGIFSVMWSEHCSYKSSKKYLKRLPTSGPQVLQGPGENAGVVSIGDGLAVVFKIESHNHPSFIEPPQAAST